METLNQEMQENIRTVFAGKKEDTSKARLVVSSEPLPNEMLKIKKLYWVCLFAILIGLVFTPLLAIGIMGAMLLYCIDDIVVKNKLDRLRRAKFKFVSGVGNDEVFQTMQPILVFFASPFWTKLQNIFGHCCKSILDKVAKHWLALNRPAV